MHRMRNAIFLFCIAACNHFNSFGQESFKCDPKRFEDDLLNKLIGQWNLTGKIGERPVENNLSAQWVLNHQFIEINFVDLASPATYFAKVSIGYDCISEKYLVHWLDNFGGRTSETLGYGIKNGRAIEFRFEYPEGPFINRFTYDDKDGSWHIHMTTKNDKGEWMVFGDEYLKRKK
jgi:hypothetical protein